MAKSQDLQVLLRTFSALPAGLGVIPDFVFSCVPTHCVFNPDNPRVESRLGGCGGRNLESLHRLKRGVARHQRRVQWGLGLMAGVAPSGVHCPNLHRVWCRVLILLTPLHSQNRMSKPFGVGLAMACGWLSWLGFAFGMD